jgi:hypothetical protein
MAGAAKGTKDSSTKGCDQKAVVGQTDVLIAILNGVEDQFVNLDYLEKR